MQSYLIRQHYPNLFWIKCDVGWGWAGNFYVTTNGPAVELVGVRVAVAWFLHVRG